MGIPARSGGSAGSPRVASERLLLTDAELTIFVAVEDLLDELGHAPTVRQIAARAGWSSVGSVAEYLERLRRHGCLVGRGRAMKLPG